MTTAPAPHQRPLLPLQPTGNRHGSRSYLTCLFKCGNACDHPIPNTSGNPEFQDVIASAIGRRAVVRGAAIGAGALVVAVGGTGSLAAAAVEPAARAAGKGGPLAASKFIPVAPNRRDAVVLADGFDHNVIISAGDAVLDGAPAFDINNLTVDALKKMFGWNNDYVGVLPHPRNKNRALMTVNHEYDDTAVMYPTGRYTQAQLAEFGIYWHGLSVVEIERGQVPGSWFQVPVGKTTYNRRINADTTFKVAGPAAGHPLLQTTADPTGTKVKGTFNNCAGGMTPWGTILSGEENFNQYFNTDGDMPAGPQLASGQTLANAYGRYGIAKSASDPRKWHTVNDRFDLAAEPNEPHRFGWIVEVDPFAKSSTPVKHTMLGRFKHEGANVTVAKNGKVVAYSGDDERGDYIYKLVSAGKFDPKGVVGGSESARKKNMTLLDKGTLYVAKLTGNDGDQSAPTAPYDGTVEWIRLCTDTTSFVDGMTVEEVLVFTRQAADLVGPTKMDRPEDVEVNPVNKKLYVALTNNSNRGTAAMPVDEANPVASSMVRSSPVSVPTSASGNRNGYVLEITPAGGDHTKPTATWDLMLVCGIPDAPETYFAGFDKTKVSAISCPDNLAFDSQGNLWISTDGMSGTLGGNDALYRVPVRGENRGQVQAFLTVPKGAECCGPLVYDKDRSVFFAPQHPGEVSGATFEAPASTWPHTRDFPIPSVCVAYRQR